MGTLYELSEEYSYLDELLKQLCLQQLGLAEEDSEPVDEQTVKDTLEAVDGEIEAKADNIAKMIFNNRSMAEALKKEEERLSKRRKACEKSVEYLKDYLQANLEFIGKTKFKTLLFSYNVATNGGQQPLFVTENIGEIPGKYLIPQPPVPDKKAIRELLAKKEVEWAHLEPRGRSLRIR